MLDFSNRIELSYLADLADAIHRVSPDLRYFLVGATARDLLLEHAYNIDPGRNTNDVDLALTVDNWEEFERLRLRLIEGGQFAPIENVAHKLLFEGRYELDLVPFGAVEQDDRTIAWPPDGSVVMNVFGFQEVYACAIEVQLPREQSIRIVSLPALVVLKLVAWEDRRLRRPGTDAYDIAVILRHYLDAGNLERLAEEAPDVLDIPDFDYEEAGAWLLGHDMAELLPDPARNRLNDLIQQEIDTDGRVNLIGDMPIEADLGLRLLRNLAIGFGITDKP